MTRSNQIQELLNNLDLSKNDKIIIAGDFNYPYRRKKFEELISHYDLKEATNNILFTSYAIGILSFFRLQLKADYVLYKNLEHIHTEKIETNYSDHFPIYSKFQI